MNSGMSSGLVSIIIMTVVTSILATRTWAVYERSRRTLIALIVGFCVCFAPTFAVFFDWFKKDPLPGGMSPLDMQWLSSTILVKQAIGEGLVSFGEGQSVWILDTCFRPATYTLLGPILFGSFSFESEWSDGPPPQLWLALMHMANRYLSSRYDVCSRDQEVIERQVIVPDHRLLLPRVSRSFAHRLKGTSPDG